MKLHQQRRFKNAVEDILKANAGALQDVKSKINRICEIEKQMYDIVERKAKEVARGGQ